MIKEIALFVCENSDSQKTDLEYVGDVVLLRLDSSQLQVFLDRLNNTVAMFGVNFTPSKCKILVQNWIGSNPNLVVFEVRSS